MPPLLPDLVTDILLRLPVKSLLRFRCLSTSFCSEIDSADFVNAHLNRSIQSRTGQKLIVYNPFRDSTDIYAADFEDDLKAAFLLNNPLKSRHVGGTLVCGSCNGLILLGTSIHFKPLIMGLPLAIWNPFTRRYKKIPVCSVQTLPEFCGYFGFGLGYDSAVDDYKIVMISAIKVEDFTHVSYPVWIFSLKSSSWRRSGDFLLVDETGTREVVGCFANGALYWDGQPGIVGFDIANEVFFKVQKLSGCGLTAICHCTLVVLGGKLYVPELCAEHKDVEFELYAEHKDVEFYLYAIDKGGEVASGSWRKEFTVEEDVMIEYDIFRPWPLAYSKQGDGILLLNKENEFVWYNFENKTGQIVEIPGMPEGMLEGMLRAPTYKHCLCLESLVSVGNDSAFDGAAEELILEDLFWEV